MKTLLYKLVLTLLSLAGILFVITLSLIPLPFSRHYSMEIVNFIETNALAISFAGFLFSWIFLSIIMWAIPILKHGRFETVAGKARVWIEHGVIEQNILNYWKEKLPMCKVSSLVVLKNNKIHITVHLPEDLSEKESLFNEIKSELPNHLQQTLGYIGDCTMSMISKRS